MRPLSEAISRVAGQNFSRKYVSLGRIVNAWENIVGQDFALKAQPVKIRYRKKKDNKKPEASLDIAVSTADATLLHYQKDVILERINQIFGNRWITSIRFVPIASNETQPKAFVKKTKRPLTQEQKNTLSNIVSNIGDSDIQQRLEMLGQHIIAESEK